MQIICDSYNFFFKYWSIDTKHSKQQKQQIEIKRLLNIDSDKHAILHIDKHANNLYWLFKKKWYIGQYLLSTQAETGGINKMINIDSAYRLLVTNMQIICIG